MKQKQRNQQHFRKWIEAGFRNYGKDPWFFLRELAQNSRDAGAENIRVNACRSPRNEDIIVFEDDGCGMTWQHASKYLFRLYASSKTHDKHSAGMFGIGFWTVLKFNPSRLVIESCFKNETWAVEVDHQLNTTPTTCTLTTPGTRVTLVRPARETSADNFSQTVENALTRYCSHLCRNTRESRLLPVRFKGKTISRPMSLPGPVTMPFKSGPVEGVVGLGEQARVQLYARGLPLWEGTTLEELSHTPPEQTKTPEITRGLAPVFIINGNNLKATISRRKAIDNRALNKVRRTAEDALFQLVEMVADSHSPRNFARRFLDKLKKKTASLLQSFWKSLLILLLLVLPLEYVLLTTFLKKNPHLLNTDYVSMKVETSRYFSASVDSGSQSPQLRLSYSPRTTQWFKLFHVETYDPVKGFLRPGVGEETRGSPFPEMDCSGDTITVWLENVEKGQLFLPLPVSHYIDSRSITLDERPLREVHYRSGGEVVVNCPGGGVISYRCCLPAGKERLTPTGRQRFTRLPEGLNLPPRLARDLDGARRLDTAGKVEWVVRRTCALLVYDQSPQTAARYTESTAEKNWLRKVLRIGAGDCDVINGFAVILLRRLNIPARLVVGVVGVKGNVLPGLHAWAEYFDDRGRYTLDVTRYTRAGEIHAAPIPMPTPSSRRSGATETLPIPPRTEASSSPALGGDPSGSAHTPPVTDTTADVEDPRVDPDTGTTFSSGNSAVADSSRRFYRFLYYGAFVLAALLSLLLLKLWRRTPVNPFKKRDLAEVEESLAGMALNALLHPDAWGETGGLMNYRLLPTLKGPAMSLKRAHKLTKQGRLYCIGADNPMAERLKKSRLPILADGHAAFAPIIRLLPGVVYLDRVAAYEARFPRTHDIPNNTDTADTAVTSHTPGEPLLSAVNRLLPVPCLVSAALPGDAVVDVNLAPLPPLGLPRRFIALNPNSGKMKEWARLFVKNPQLACFHVVEMLLKETLCFDEPHDVVLRRVSRKLAEEVA